MSANSTLVEMDELASTDATKAVLLTELNETKASVNGLVRLLEKLSIQLERVPNHTPLAQTDLKKRVRDAEFRLETCRNLIRCLREEVAAWDALQRHGSEMEKKAKALLEFTYGTAAVNTNRARAQLFSTEEEARLLDLLKPIPAATAAEEDGAELTPQQLLEMYERVCDFHRRAQPARTRARRQELGAMLCDANVALERLDLFTVTWNVGNTAPSAADLEKLVPMQNNRLYDIVAIGLQECGFDLTPGMMERAMHFKTKVKREHKSILKLAEEEFFTESQQQQQPASKLGLGNSHLNMGTLLKMEKASKRAVTSRAGDYFAFLLLDHLGAEDYLLLRNSEFSDMRLFCFVRREHAPRVTQVEYASQSTGFGGVAGNKGGVAVSFRFQHVRICITSCHLAAHRKFVKQRNADCAQILSMMQSKLGTRSASYMSDWDYVILLGDLNYRLDLTNHVAAVCSEQAAMAPTKQQGDGEEGEAGEQGASFNKSKLDHTEQERRHVLDLMAREQWEALMKFDQLRMEQKRGNALFAFREAEVYSFPPTFKLVDRGNSDLHLRYAHNRLPAYCDRILWYASPALTLHAPYELMSQVEFFSPANMTTSDHNPVCSRFLISMGQVDLTVAAAAAAGTATQSARSGLPLARWILPGSSTFAGKNKRSSSTVGMQIAVWNLRAENLAARDLTGKSDPYVVAYSTNLFPLTGQRGSTPKLCAARTGVRFQTLDCDWKDTVLAIRCPPEFSSSNSLRGKHLTLSLQDFDFTSYDDSMGEVLLALDDLVTAFETSVPVVVEYPDLDKPASVVTNNAPRAGQVEFHLPIVLHGKRTGTLRGTAALHAPFEHIKSTTQTISDYAWKAHALWEYASQRF